MKNKRITRAEAQAFLAEVVSTELERIEEERYFEPQAISPAAWRQRNLAERNRAIAIERVASMGHAAALFDEDRAVLSKQGYSEDDLRQVESSITECVAQTQSPDFHEATTELARRVLPDYALSEVDLNVLTRVRLSGQAEALMQSDRRFQTTPFVGLQSDTDPVEPVPVAPAPQRDEAHEVERRPGYSDSFEDLQAAYIAQDFKDLDDPAEQRKRLKTRRQTEAVLTQFRHATGVLNLRDLKQEDLYYYCTVLDRLPKIYGRSAADRALSLQEILERGENLSEDQIGLSAATINRNLSHIRNFLKFARSRGSRPAEELYLADLRRQEDGDERSARLAFSDEDVELLFRHPVWQGCRNDARRNLPGGEVIQDGLYWGPLIAAASGARREEIMGLEQSDVVLDHAVPHFLIRKNRNRCLKNAGSQRKIPIHSKLIELGFPDYVEAMANKGAEDLFPEFRPSSESETFGNVFYKPWKTVLDQQLGPSSARKTFHSFRHRTITTLRHDPDIPKSWVKDLVGHKHGDVTDGRYRDPTPLGQLQVVVETLSIGI
ncbi:MAG: site-specific integrase [Paracoccaceae bacterium]